MRNQIINKIIALDDIENITVGQYADAVRKPVKEPNKEVIEKEPVFPKGFKCWAETHHLIVERLTLMNEKPDDEKPQRLLDIDGTGSLWKLCQDFTQRFEEERASKVWDFDYFGAIDEFLNKEFIFAHEKDNAPYKINFEGKDYLAREIYDKKENTFYIVAHVDLETAITKSGCKSGEIIDESIVYYTTDEELLMTDEELINLIHN